LYSAIKSEDTEALKRIQQNIHTIYFSPPIGLIFSARR